MPEDLRSLYQEEIIRRAVGFEPILKKKIINPLRPRDKSPGAYFIRKQGIIRLIDHASPENSGLDCWDIYMRMTGKTFPEAKDDIFGKDRERTALGIPGLTPWRIPIYDYRMTCDWIDFSQEGLDYWAAYGITEEQLIHDGVRQVGSYSGSTVNSDTLWRMLVPDDICFMLPMLNGRMKLYRPLTPIKSTKWKSDIHFGDMWYLRSSEEATEVADICTSYKDARVVFNAQDGEVDVYGQAGGEATKIKDIAGFSIMPILKRRHKRIRIKGDFDSAGRKSADAWKHALNFHQIPCEIVHHEELIVGDKVLKDYADLKKYGYL